MTDKEKMEVAQYIIDHQTTKVGDIPVVADIGDGAATIPVTQPDGTLARVSVKALKVNGGSKAVTAADITAALGFMPEKTEPIGDVQSLCDEYLGKDSGGSGGGPAADDEPMSDEEISELIGEAWA